MSETGRNVVGELAAAAAGREPPAMAAAADTKWLFGKTVAAAKVETTKLVAVGLADGRRLWAEVG